MRLLLELLTPLGAHSVVPLDSQLFLVHQIELARNAWLQRRPPPDHPVV